MHAASYLLLAASAFVAGGMNAIAGGGSFLTFPALVFTGVPSIVANASNTVALFPGNFSAAWAYRRDLRDFDGVPFWHLLIASVAGGVVGAVLLLSTTQRLFSAIVPWLLLAATLAFTFGPHVPAHVRRVLKAGPKVLLPIQFVLTVYGGYFGAAVGIMLLAAWTVLGRRDIHGMNAAKTVFVGATNCVATVCFVLAGKVWWPQTLVMLVAAVAGGFCGASVARRLDPRWVRGFIIAVSAIITAIFFLRR